jgi:hypothetical protein
MKDFEKLVDTIGYNKAFLAEDLKSLKISKRAADKLVNSGLMIKYDKCPEIIDKNIYYIPDEENEFDPVSVIQRLFIKNDVTGEVFGYEAGAGLISDIGLCDRVPGELIVYTNKYSDQMKHLIIENYGVQLIETQCAITNSNVNVLRLLEAIEILSKFKMVGSFTLRKITKAFSSYNLDKDIVSSYGDYYDFSTVLYARSVVS